MPENPVIVHNDAHADIKGLQLDSPRLMRLFEVRYRCPLCSGDHTIEMYFALGQGNLDDLHARAKETVHNPHAVMGLYCAHAKRHHEEQGNYQALRKLMALRDDGPATGTVSIQMTGEADFRCPECAHTFDNLAELRLHAGQDPKTGSKAGAMACDPHAP